MTRRFPPLVFRTVGAAYLAMGFFAPQARAQSGDPLAAEALFEDARKLMLAGNYADACPKLEASQRLDPGVGTLLNLADCLEKVGRTASAWERFREAASAALGSGQREREAIARGRVRALEPKLCRLRVDVADAGKVAAMTVERDGVVLDPLVWGQAIPVDPGRHPLRAVAPGKRSYSTVVSLEPSCPGTVTVVPVPRLEDDPASAVAPSPPAGSTSPPSSALAPGAAPASPLGPPPLEAATTRWGTQRKVALGVGGMAVAAAAVGTYFAVTARADYDDAKSKCTTGGCPSTDAGTRADYATGAAVVAIAAAAAGLTLWLTAPRHALAVVPQAGGVFGAVARVTFP